MSNQELSQMLSKDKKPSRRKPQKQAEKSNGRSDAEWTIFIREEVKEWARHLIDDDPVRAMYLLDLLVHTDTSTAEGFLARDEVLRFAYGFTEECQEAIKQRVARAN